MVEIVYRSLRDLSSDLWIKIARLYTSNPVDHCYLLNGLIYNPDRSEAIFVLKSNDIIGYVYASSFKRGLRIVLWGEASPDLLNLIFMDSSFLIVNFQRDANGIVLEPYLKILEEKGYSNRELSFYYDMVTDENSFKPFKSSNVRRLTERDVDAFIEIREIQDRPISREEALEHIKRRLYYGVFEDDKLVGIAGARIKLPEVWIIGNVFVRPEYRGRGYGKAVTSAVTEDAVRSGAVAYLQVETGNAIAIGIYERLGYRILRKNPWIFAERGSGEQR